MKVNLDFGGFVSANWGNLNQVMDVYRQIATTYDLVKPRGAFNLEFDINSELVGVTFNYKKLGMSESGLQAFNDLWAGIAVQYGITRNQTMVTYYTD